MYCFECGKEVQNNWKYCYYCGTDLRSVLNLPKDDDFEFLDIGEEDDGWVHVFDGEVVPNSKNIKEHFNVVYKNRSLVRENGELEICRERNGETREVSFDPYDYLYSSIDIQKKVSSKPKTPIEENNDPNKIYVFKYYEDLYGEEPEIAYGLSDLRDYILVENGVIYVKDSDIYFLDNIGKKTVIVADISNIVKIKLMEDSLLVFVFEGLKQIAWNEHRDECGYMFEAYYDRYKVDLARYSFDLEKFNIDFAK